MSAGYLSLVPMALIAALAIPLSVIDIREHRLPNRHTYFLIASAIAGTLLASLLGALWLDFASGIAMGIVTAFVGYLLARFGAIGMGDVKLLIAMHICLGWHSPVLVLFSLSLGLALASAIGLIGLLLGRPCHRKYRQQLVELLEGQSIAVDIAQIKRSLLHRDTVRHRVLSNLCRRLIANDLI